MNYKFFYSNRSVLLASILFIAFMFFMTMLIMFGQNKLIEYEKKEVVSELSKLSFNIQNILDISKEQINILSENKAISSYFSNKALGMSLKYGLTTNLIKIEKELEFFLENKKIEKIKMFDFIKIFNNHLELISGEKKTLSENLNAYLTKEYKVPTLISFVENDFFKVFILKSIYINDVKVGIIASKVNFIELLNKFVISDKYRDIVYLKDLDKNFDIQYLMSVNLDRYEKFIEDDIGNTNIKVLYNFESNNKFYTSNKFIIFLIFLSIMIYFLIYYIFKINSKNILLKSKMNRTRKSNLILEKKILLKTEELEELNKKLQEKVEIEINKNKKNQSILYNQSKMAIMGQMLDNIAHQWRQPLSAISTNASFLKLQKELEILDDKTLTSTMDNIIDSTKFLSETIEDFRDFLRENKKKQCFRIRDIYFKTRKLLISVTKTSEVTIIEKLDDIVMCGYFNELIQVFLNIINNAYDAFSEIEDDRKKYIFISVYRENDENIIKIKDNAGGIPLNIINKIFEANFTTKDKKNGTGIGLYMTKDIIVNNMKGKIYAQNVSYEYEGISYYGSEFTIILPGVIEEPCEKVLEFN